jgi:hypothetical protein
MTRPNVPILLTDIGAEQLGLVKDGIPDRAAIATIATDDRGVWAENITQNGENIGGGLRVDGPNPGCKETP